jgi:putative transposase
LAYVSRRQHQMAAAVIRTAFVQENHAEARNELRATADKLRGRFPRLGELMDQAEGDVLAFMHFPKEHWPQLASTNTLERLNKELKRRSRVIGIFPNDAAIIRLIGTLMAEQTDEWQVTRRYMAVDTLARVINRKHQEVQLLEGEAA